MSNELKKTQTPILIGALRILARDIQTDDGVANSCIYEGAQRIEDLTALVGELVEALQACEKRRQRVDTSIYKGAHVGERVKRTLAKAKRVAEVCDV